MKRCTFLSFVLALLLFVAPATSNAAFVIAAHNNTEAASAAEAAVDATLMADAQADIATTPANIPAPPTLERAMYRGWFGTVAFICGIAGFAWPFLSLVAVLFGFLGMGKYRRKRSLALIGFLLGIAVILGVVFAGYTALPIF